jgi:hypothetical protein
MLGTSPDRTMGMATRRPREVAGRAACVYTVREGKITSVEMWDDREAALAGFGH